MSRVTFFNYVEKQLNGRRKYFDQTFNLEDFVKGDVWEYIGATLQLVAFIIHISKEQDQKDRGEVTAIFEHTYDVIRSVRTLIANYNDLNVKINDLKTKNIGLAERMFKEGLSSEFTKSYINNLKEITDYLTEQNRIIARARERIAQLSELMISLIDKTIKLAKQMLEEDQQLMKRCNFCGEKMPSYALYCGSCGRKL